MGAWGAGSFENDAALDWVWSLEQSDDLSPVEAAISDVLNGDDYLDADVGCTGLAAAEVVAALRDRALDGLPEEVSQWVETHEIAASDALVKNCLTAVEKIGNDDTSELKELWEEGGDPATEWHSVLDDLVARLQ
jgi:hypothetical protein